MKEGIKPAYEGGSLVNLMASIQNALSPTPSGYTPLKALPAEALKTPKNVVLMVIDALGYNYLNTVGKDSCLARHLQSSMTSMFPSTTTVSINTFNTGLMPQHHALTGWNIWFEELGAVIQPLPFKTRGGSLPLADSDYINTTCLLQASPLTKLLSVNCSVIMPDSIVNSPYNLAFTKGAEKIAYTGLDAFFDKTAQRILQGKTNQYIYSYWSALDHIGHMAGIHSETAKQHFAEIDQAFEQFLQKIQGSDTTLIITGDHGMIDSTADSRLQLSEHPRLAECLTVPLCGEPRSVFCYVRAFKQQQFEDYINNEFADYMHLVPSEQLIEEGYFGIGKVNPKLYKRIGDYTLLMKDNYVLYDQLYNEERHSMIGVHGGLSEDEMLVPLIVVNC